MSGRMTGSCSSKKGTEGLTERASYAYDYRGLLVRKTYSDFTAGEGVSITGGSTATVTEWYEYNQNGQLLYTEKSDGTATAKTDYIWAETTLWCEVDDGNVYWHHTDHLGTTEAVTDEAGTVVWHAEYEAFGSVLSENGSMAFTPSFTGKMLDECSGLYYFNAQWYNSEMGRFITQDPARDGVNWWNYCNSNPVTYTDPDGRTQVYFLYTYKKDSFYDQQMLRDEWSSIMDEVKKLRENGISVVVNLAVKKQDIKNAFKDEESTLIVTSGHGYKDGSIQTTEGLHFYPDDIPDEISGNLKTVVMENCRQDGSKWYKNENGINWRDKLGSKIKFIGWKGTTTIYESINFNNQGWFDRQEQTLYQLVDEVIANSNKQKEENDAE